MLGLFLKFLFWISCFGTNRLKFETDWSFRLKQTEISNRLKWNRLKFLTGYERHPFANQSFFINVCWIYGKTWVWKCRYAFISQIMISIFQLTSLFITLTLLQLRNVCEQKTNVWLELSLRTQALISNELNASTWNNEGTLAGHENDFDKFCLVILKNSHYEKSPLLDREEALLPKKLNSIQGNFSYWLFHCEKLLLSNTKHRLKLIHARLNFTWRS